MENIPLLKLLICKKKGFYCQFIAPFSTLYTTLSGNSSFYDTDLIIFKKVSQSEHTLLQMIQISENT